MWSGHLHACLGSGGDRKNTRLDRTSPPLSQPPLWTNSPGGILSVFVLLMLVEAKGNLSARKAQDLGGMCLAPWLLWGSVPNCQGAFQSELMSVPVTTALAAWKDQPSGGQPTPSRCLTLPLSQVGPRESPTWASPTGPGCLCPALGLLLSPAPAACGVADVNPGTCNPRWLSP